MKKDHSRWCKNELGHGENIPCPNLFERAFITV